MVLDGERQPRREGRAQRLHDAVGKQVGASVVARSDQPGGHCQRGGEIRRAIARRDLVDRAMQRIAVTGDGRDDSRHRPDGNDGHPVLRAELVDDGIGLALGHVEA